jgi:predicted Fe-Mo cluster-binding NifX family protein
MIAQPIRVNRQKERNQMRIAVPTNDGKSISEHFGRSAGFLVFEIENDQVKNRETRTNEMQHSHEQGTCHPAAGGSGPHSHASLVSTLAGCEVVLCAGMGQRAAEALRSSGITPVLVSASASAEEAVAAYLAGKLLPADESFCRCHH